MSRIYKRPKRGSLNIHAALRYKPAFDAAIERKTDVKISAVKLGISPQTLKNRLNEALLFICRELKDEDFNDTTFTTWKYKKIDYLTLRAKVRFKFDDAYTAVYISYGKFHELAPEEYVVTNELLDQMQDFQEKRIEKALESRKAEGTVGAGVGNIIAVGDWKERVTNFMNGEEAILIIKGVKLNSEDKIWLYKLLGDTGFEFTVGVDDIRIAR